MAALTTEERVRVAVLLSQWRTVSFVHWPVEPAAVQALLPPGLAVDVFDGQAWVTITPLLMSEVRLPRLGILPRLTFAETNFRTYVRGPDGRDGVYFLKIEAASATMTLAARSTVGAPYALGDLSIVEHDGVVSYGGALRNGRGSYRLDVRPGRRLVDPSDRDVWLTGRWRAYTWHLGRLLESSVEHEPWPLSTATVGTMHQTLADSVGLPGPPPEPVVHFSEGVLDVRVGIARLVH